jgi:hypothetical protein
MWDIELKRVKPWLESLSTDDYHQVIAALELLQERSPRLGRPLVDTNRR